MSKFVHCIIIRKIKALPRGKAGTSWEATDLQNIVLLIDVSRSASISFA